MRHVVGFFIVIATAFAVHAQTPKAIDSELAAKYFAESREVVRRDNGRLWKRSLEAPMMFVDASTRRLVASAPDAEGKLTREGSVYVGVLPNEVPAANTAVRWAGVKWTQILWPLPVDANQRAMLYAHELFHHAQEDLGLPNANPSNAHLDTADGRIWLQLEWRALREALVTRGQARQRAIIDALIFRYTRQKHFSAGAEEERALEINEGLAEYTGVALGATTPEARTAAAVALIDGASSRPTFTRSFAYVSGPAYGLLLDARQGPWRSRMRGSSDLGRLLADAYRIRLSPRAHLQAAVRAKEYDGPALVAAERERESRHQALLRGYRSRLVEGRVLRLPLMKMQMSFDPNTLVSLGADGTVYPTISLSDAWGVLTVTDGALIASDWSAIVVAAPANADARSGEGWTLELAHGWRLQPGSRGFVAEAVKPGP